MINNTFILLSRAIIDSDVFASQKLLKIWIWCLCKASYKDRIVSLKIGRGETPVKIKRGQFIFGRHKAEEELFIDGSTIYKSMQKLKQLGNISIKSNNQYSIITINKYDTYQSIENYKVTSKEQVSNRQVTSKEQVSNTNKEGLNKVNTIKEEYINVVNEVLGKRFKLTDKIKPKVEKILNEYSIGDIRTAIENAKSDKFHKDNGHKYLTSEFFTRSDKIEMWLNAKNGSINTKKEYELYPDKDA